MEYILLPHWGYKYGRPAGATQIGANIHWLQIFPPRWGYTLLNQNQKFKAARDVF